MIENNNLLTKSFFVFFSLRFPLRRRRNGIMEFDSARNRIPSSGLDCFHLLDYRYLPASHLEFPQKKVTQHKIHFPMICCSSLFFQLCLWFFFSRLVSVVGLNFDFVVLNLTKHTSYLIYNATLYFSYDVQQQYFDKYGFKEVSTFLYFLTWFLAQF